MKLRPNHLLEWSLMVGVSAGLFVGFFELNDLLFSSVQHAQGIDWIFLPAGFRVLLVLVMGMPGALGIVAGNLWLDQDLLRDGHLSQVGLTAIVSGLGPWAVRQWMTSRQWLDKDLKDITLASLVNFVLCCAALNALLNQLIRWNFHFANSQPLVDVWPMFVGDAIGATAVIYGFRLGLPWLRQWVRPQSD